MFEVSNNNINCQSTHLAQVVRLSPSVETTRHQSFTIVLMKRKWFSVWLFALEKKILIVNCSSPKNKKSIFVIWMFEISYLTSEIPKMTWVQKILQIPSPKTWSTKTFVNLAIYKYSVSPTTRIFWYPTDNVNG